jgi:hypothetical protein
VSDGGLGEPPSSRRWTCGYCGVEVRWTNGQDRQGLPTSWTVDHRGPVCLACRRQRAAEAAVDGSAPGLSVGDRARLRSAAIIEFEVRRDPSRSNAEIAHAVHTSVVSIQKARKRLRAPAAQSR